MIDDMTFEKVEGRWFTELSKKPSYLCETGCGEPCAESKMMCQEHCDEFTQGAYGHFDSRQMWLDSLRLRFLPRSQLAVWDW